MYGLSESLAGVFSANLQHDPSTTRVLLHVLWNVIDSVVND